MTSSRGSKLTPSAIFFASSVDSFGSASKMSAPMSGMTPMVVSHGSEDMSDHILTKIRVATTMTAPANMDKA